MDAVLEVGKISHDSRANTFALKTENRLYVFDALDTEDMNSWLRLFKGLQPNSIEENASVPQSTVGSVQKAILKVLTNIKSKFNKDDATPEGSTKQTDSRPASPIQTKPSENRMTTVDPQRNSTGRVQTGIRMTTTDRSTTVQSGLNKQVVIPNSFQGKQNVQ